MLAAIGQRRCVVIGRHQDNRLQITDDDSSVVDHTQPVASAKEGSDKSGPDGGAVVDAISKLLRSEQRALVQWRITYWSMSPL